MTENKDLQTRKDSAIDTLTKRYSQNELSMEEYERLVSDIQRADNIRELQVIEEIVFGVSASSREAGFLPEDQVQTSYAILSERKLSGSWLHKRAAATVSFLGSHVIDLRDTDLPAGKTVIEVFALLGSIEIIVPRELSVQIEVTPIAGDVTVGRGVDVREGSGNPLLVVSGSAILGSVAIKQR